MLHSVRSEWIKVSTLLSVKVLLGIAIAFPVVIVVLTTILGNGIRDSVDLTDLITGLSLVTVLLVGVVAVMGATAEYSHNTIRPTFAAQPGRLRPLLAKLLVHVAITLAVIAVVLAASWLLGSIIVGDDGYFPFWSVRGARTATVPAFAGLVVLVVGVTCIAIGLGLLMRNVAATVATLLLWPLLLETLVRGLFYAVNRDHWEKYLPFTQGISIGFFDRTSDDAMMSRIGGGVYFGLWALAVLAAGLWRSQRSDA